MKKKLVILSGAGISAESGIATFRDTGGLWANYKIEEVCTPQAWDLDPTKVNDFYNMRRIEVLNTQPNKGHYDLAKAEEDYDIFIITQNVDDLHERAGSSNILHLHGEILKARSSNPNYYWAGMSSDISINNPKLYDVGREGLNYYKNYADDGYPLRPHVVFFGESVPKLEDAIDIMKTADILFVVGTSLNVYPASSLIYDVPNHCKKFCIDPNIDDIDTDFTMIKENATTGIEIALNLLKSE